MYDIFAKLCETRGVTPYKVSQATGIARTTFSEWKNGKYTPKQDKLQLIADYFEVPIEYLMTGEMPKDSYYLDERTAEIAQQIFERPELKVLFDASRKASKEDVEFVAEMLEKLYRKEHPED